MLLIYENKRSQQEGVRNAAGEIRGAGRIVELEAIVANHGQQFNLVHKLVQRITQCSVKFIRWLRRVFLFNTDPQIACDRFGKSYSEFRYEFWTPMFPLVDSSKILMRGAPIERESEVVLGEDKPEITETRSDSFRLQYVTTKSVCPYTIPLIVKATWNEGVAGELKE